MSLGDWLSTQWSNFTVETPILIIILWVLTCLLAVAVGLAIGCLFCSPPLLCQSIGICHWRRKYSRLRRSDLDKPASNPESAKGKSKPLKTSTSSDSNVVSEGQAQTSITREEGSKRPSKLPSIEDTTNHPTEGYDALLSFEKLVGEDSHHINSTSKDRSEKQSKKLFVQVASPSSDLSVHSKILRTTDSLLWSCNENNGEKEINQIIDSFVEKWFEHTAINYHLREGTIPNGGRLDFRRDDRLQAEDLQSTFPSPNLLASLQKSEIDLEVLCQLGILDIIRDKEHGSSRPHTVNESRQSFPSSVVRSISTFDFGEEKDPISTDLLNKSNAINGTDTVVSSNSSYLSQNYRHHFWIGLVQTLVQNRTNDHRSPMSDTDRRNLLQARLSCLMNVNEWIEQLLIQNREDIMKEWISHLLSESKILFTREEFLVGVGIEGFDQLWSNYDNQFSHSLQLSLLLYFELLKNLTSVWEGRIVYSKESFSIVSFHSLTNAFEFALDFQRRLLRLPWPVPLLQMSESSKIVLEDEALSIIFRGLRQKALIAKFIPDESVEQCFDKILTVLESDVVGGDVVLTDQIWSLICQRIEYSLSYREENLHTCKLDSFHSNALNSILWLVFPKELKSRYAYRKNSFLQLSKEKASAKRSVPQIRGQIISLLGKDQRNRINKRILSVFEEMQPTAPSSHRHSTGEQQIANYLSSIDRDVLLWELNLVNCQLSIYQHVNKQFSSPGFIAVERGEVYFAQFSLHNIRGIWRECARKNLSLELSKDIERYYNIIFKIILKHRGEILTQDEDSTYASFKSIVDVVNCSLEVQVTLLQVQWNEKLINHIADLANILQKEELLYNGFRSRIAILSATIKPADETERSTILQKIWQELRNLISYSIGGEIIIASKDWNRLEELDLQTSFLEPIYPVKEQNEDVCFFVPSKLRSRFDYQNVESVDVVENELSLQEIKEILERALQDLSHVPITNKSKDVPNHRNEIVSSPEDQAKEKLHSSLFNSETDGSPDNDFINISSIGLRQTQPSNENLVQIIERISRENGILHEKLSSRTEVTLGANNLDSDDISRLEEEWMHFQDRNQSLVESMAREKQRNETLLQESLKKVQELEDESRSLRLQMEHQKRQNDAGHPSLLGLNSDQIHSTANEHYAKENAELKQIIFRLESEVNHLKLLLSQQLEDHEILNQDLEGQVITKFKSSLRNSFNITLQEKSNINSMISELNDALGVLIHENSRTQIFSPLKAIHDSFYDSARDGQLEKKVRELENERDSLLKQNERLHEGIAITSMNHNNDLQSLNTQIYQLRKELDKQLAKVKTLTLQTLQNEDSEKRLLQLESTNHELFETIHQQKKDMEAEKERHKTEIGRYLDKVSNLEQLVQSKRLEKEAFILRIGELDKQLLESTKQKQNVATELKEKSELLETERYSLQRKIQGLEEQLSRSNQKNSKMEELLLENRRLWEENRMAEDQLALALKELRELSTETKLKLHHLESKNTTFAAENATLNTIVASLTDENHKIYELRNHIAQLHQENNSLAEMLRLNQERDLLHKRVKVQEEQFEQQKNALLELGIATYEKVQKLQDLQENSNLESILSDYMKSMQDMIVSTQNISLPTEIEMEDSFPKDMTSMSPTQATPVRSDNLSITNDETYHSPLSRILDNSSLRSSPLHKVKYFGDPAPTVSVVWNVFVVHVSDLPRPPKGNPNWTYNMLSQVGELIYASDEFEYVTETGLQTHPWTKWLRLFSHNSKDIPLQPLLNRGLALFHPILLPYKNIQVDNFILRRDAISVHKWWELINSQGDRWSRMIQKEKSASLQQLQTSPHTSPLQNLSVEEFANILSFLSLADISQLLLVSSTFNKSLMKWLDVCCVGVLEVFEDSPLHHI